MEIDLERLMADLNEVLDYIKKYDSEEAERLLQNIIDELLIKKINSKGDEELKKAVKSVVDYFNYWGKSLPPTLNDPPEEFNLENIITIKKAVGLEGESK